MTNQASKVTTPFSSSPNLQKLSEVMQRANKYAEQALKKASGGSTTKTKRFFLKGVSEYKKAMPSYIARSGIFAPVSKKYNNMHDDTVFLQGDNILIKGSGKQLSEDHADIWLHAIFLQTTVLIGEQPVINRAKFLRGLGRKTGGSQYNWLHNAIKDLSRFTLCIEAKHKNGKVKYSFGNHPSTRVLAMLGGFDYDDKTGNYTLYIDPRWTDIFDNREYALIDWNKRLLLKHDLSKSLQRLISTSADIQQHFSVETLKERGQYSGRNRDFKKYLERSLIEIKNHEIITEFSIEKNSRGQEIVSWIKS